MTSSHGYYSTYQEGCRCSDCRWASAEYMRDYRRRKTPKPTPEVLRARKPTDWQKYGNCVGVDPDLFFPERGDMASVKAAKQVCAGCSVRAECLEYANTDPVEWPGIFGGKTDTERRKMRAAQKRQVSA